jgi:hypothetical protein
MFGARGFSNSSHLPAVEGSKFVNPVRLPPGRVKLWTLPGSSANVLHRRWPSCGFAEKARIGRDLFRSEDDPPAAKPATPLLSLRWTFSAKESVCGDHGHRACPACSSHPASADRPPRGFSSSHGSRPRSRLERGLQGPPRKYVAAFHRGLADARFAEGRNVAIEYRWRVPRRSARPSCVIRLVLRRNPTHPRRPIPSCRRAESAAVAALRAPVLLRPPSAPTLGPSL